MKRKVMKVGPATLVISLPSVWIKKLKIEKGDELEVTEYEKGLQITTKKEHSPEKKFIAISKYNPIIMRTLGILYKVGYNEIKIPYDENRKLYLAYGKKEYNEIDFIRRAVESYSGMDIKEIKRDNEGSYVMITERARLLPEEFKNTMNQAFLHLCFISEEIYEALSKNKRNIQEKIDLTDNLINQTTNFCQKVLNKHGYEQFWKTTFVYLIVAGIEQLGDKYRELYEYYANQNFKVTDEILVFHAKINSALNGFYALFRKFDIKKLSDLGTALKNLSEEYEKLLEKCSRKELRILFYLNNIREQTYDLLEPLMAFYHEELT